MNQTLHQLQWRGRAVGPWTLPQIREALVSGEIHSLYLIQVMGQWLTLRDHLEALDATELERRAAQLGARLREKKAEQGMPAQRIGRNFKGLEGAIVKRNAFGNPPPVFVKPGSRDSAMRDMDDLLTPISDTAPTCWLAVVAFVISCASFVPYLNLVSWVPSLVLGHLSLRKMQRQPYLEGRGLAIGALVIGYTTLAVAVVTALFLPSLFYRIFPIRDA
jgi:hypothetical protein